MADIIITEKPESVSYDELCALLDRIHEGEDIEFNTSGMKGAEFEEKLNGGICFTALAGDGRPVGLIAVCRESCNAWYFKGEVGRIRNVGVLPEYRGQGIGRRLVRKAEDWTRDQGIGAVMLSTSEYNVKAISLYRRSGFVFVDCRKFKSLDHCSVFGMKWAERPPKPMLYLKLRYLLRSLSAHRAKRRK